MNCLRCGAGTDRIEYIERPYEVHRIIDVVEEDGLTDIQVSFEETTPSDEAGEFECSNCGDTWMVDAMSTTISYH